MAKDPLVLIFAEDAVFDTVDYIDLGFTNFDVICIGGGGGSGGGIDTANTGTLVRSYGGAGGGGGIQRVRGVLSGLPSSLDIVVGAAGAAGSTQPVDPALTTDGGDGGGSSFNVDICRASGGKGGKRVQNNSLTVGTFADGGEGGTGGTVTVGGGALGGTAGVPTESGPGTSGTNAQDGTWDGAIGSGGGGGAGGIGKYPTGVTCNAATAGGKGAYNINDSSAYATGGYASTDPNSEAASVMPGFAGGAKAALISSLPTVYGSSKMVGAGNPGVVIVRLTTE